jgi:L-aminopeptidase/D-esterase-like protein
MDLLAEQGIGFPTAARPVPVVPAAILYDLGLGRGDRTPGAREGRIAALRAKGGRVPRGSIGAGAGATVAKALGPERLLKGGIGTASVTDGSGLVAGALVAVNAVGSVVDPRTAQTVAGPRGDEPGTFIALDDSLERHRLHWRQVLEAANTTIGLVAVNATLDHPEVQRLAAIAHDGLARTIVPAHTRGDGDTMFAVATGAHPPALTDHYPLVLLVLRAVERAVLDAITSATSLGGVPSAAEWRASR